jgi:hypothetical protein
MKNSSLFCESPKFQMARCKKCYACRANREQKLAKLLNPDMKLKSYPCKFPIQTDILRPCGKCRACNISKVNEKMLVSVFAAHEFKKKGQFLTLTYNDESRPNGLKHSDFSGFMKRLRERTDTPGVKLYVAGEYGEKSGREHFHVLFYNYKYDIEDIKACWIDTATKEPLGFVYDGTLTPKSMKYVSGYVCKKGYDPGTGKRPPYGRMSCNIDPGLKSEEVYKMANTGKIAYNGRTFKVPRSWRRRFKSVWDFFVKERKEYVDTRLPFDFILTPAYVTGMMDERERKYALSRNRRKAHNVYYV